MPALEEAPRVCVPSFVPVEFERVHGPSCPDGPTLAARVRIGDISPCGDLHRNESQSFGGDCPEHVVMCSAAHRPTADGNASFWARRRTSDSRDVGGEEVDAVSVQVASGAVVVLGGAWIGVPGQDLCVSEWYAWRPGRW